MRKYETVIILNPDLKDQARTDLSDKVKNIISKENGILLDFDTWGNKKLAYEIKKKLRGFYVCVTYGGTGELVKELERNLRLSDDSLKFMTILLSDDVTTEQLEEEAKENQDKLSGKTEEKPAKKDAAPVESTEKSTEKSTTEPTEKSAEEATATDDTPEDDSKVEETTEEN